MIRLYLKMKLTRQQRVALRAKKAHIKLFIRSHYKEFLVGVAVGLLLTLLGLAGRTDQLACTIATQC